MAKNKLTAKEKAEKEAKEKALIEAEEKAKIEKEAKEKALIEAEEKAKIEKEAEEKAEKERKGKVKKYFFKSESELGFKKRNYFVPGANKRVVVVAGEETTEEIFKILDSKAKEVFLTQKEVEELEKAKVEKEGNM